MKIKLILMFMVKLKHYSQAVLCNGADIVVFYRLGNIEKVYRKMSNYACIYLSQY